MSYGVLPRDRRLSVHMASVTPGMARKPRPSPLLRALVILGKAATVVSLGIGFGMIIAGWMAP